MQNFKTIAVITTFFSVWLTGFFSDFYQNNIAFFLIFTVGILHGSNDLAIISQLENHSYKKKYRFFIGSYILTVFTATLLFYFLPQIALLFFIFFSAFHFGEQHWNELLVKKNVTTHLVYISYGLTILFLLFYFNPEETLAVIQSLTSVTYSSVWLKIGLCIAGVIFVSMVVLKAFKKELVYKQLVFELFLLMVFTVVFSISNLVWSFAIYFILWHSIPSIGIQLQYLYKEISMLTFFKYIKASFLIWLISIGGMLLLYLLLRNNKEILLPLLFSFLGAVTFAHSFIMTKMFEAGSKKNR